MFQPNELEIPHAPRLTIVRPRAPLKTLEWHPRSQLDLAETATIVLVKSQFLVS